MKKLVKYGVLPACLLMLVACSSKPVVEKPQTKEDKVEQSSESKEERQKNKLKKMGILFFVPSLQIILLVSQL